MAAWRSGVMISVALFEADPQCRSALPYGVPQREDSVPAGRQAHFDDTACFLYQLTTRRTQAFLVRGLGSVQIPGISSAVNVLAHAEGAAASRRLVHSVRWLLARDVPPTALSDVCWLRLAGLLGKPNFGPRELRAVLARHP